MSDQFIVIPNWDRFQHYKGVDRPAWIKVHSSLIHDDAFLDLTVQQRMALVGIWILYAESGRKLAVDTAKLSRQLSQKITTRTLASLHHAGFIEFSSRDGLETVYAQKRREEKRREELSEGTNDAPTNPLPNMEEQREHRRGNGWVENLGAYTGCRVVRGESGISHVYDPLGTEPVPSNWTYARPTRLEVQRALKERSVA